MMTCACKECGDTAPYLAWCALHREYMQREVDGALKMVEANAAKAAAQPIPMVLHCPECRTRHLDEGAFATKPHHTHACQSCGFVWRPAVVATVGVRFLPGFKNAESR